MDYYQYSIQVKPIEPWVEILLMEMLELGFESFQETDLGMDAFVPLDKNPTQTISFLNEFAVKNNIFLSFEQILLPAKNWNAAWESNFEVIKVGEFCAIRAPFHEPVLDCRYDLVISPKMSFGTGHHPTTFLMVKAMESINFKGNRVLDMGSGTGVLGILAAKLGAAEITAIDIEDWAVENAQENAKVNAVSMEVLLGGKEAIPNKIFDVVLANINRNILLDQLLNYHHVLCAKGLLLLSGFMFEDQDVMIAKTQERGFKLKNNLQKENWVCLVFEKI